TGSHGLRTGAFSWARDGLVDAGGSLLAPPCSREPRSHAHLVFCRFHTEGTLIRTRQASDRGSCFGASVDKAKSLAFGARWCDLFCHGEWFCGCGAEYMITSADFIASAMFLSHSSCRC